MAVKTQITWKYLPTHLFKGSVVLTLESGEIVVCAGDATLTLAAPISPITSALLRKLSNEVVAVFAVGQFLTDQLFELNGPQIIQHQEDGSIGAAGFFAIPSVNVKLKVKAPELKVTSADGAVVSDTKAECAASEASFVATMVRKVALSPVLHAMVKSYNQANQDPKNALIYLYEIRDAVCAYYGSPNDSKNKKREMAISALGIDERDMDRLHKLANDVPLLEGRHRGSKSQLRPATQEELAEARRIARRFIELFAEKL